MLTGWWGLIAYFANLVVLAANLLEGRRLAAVPRPGGEALSPPLPPGRRLWARPAALIAAAAVGVPLAIIAAALIGPLLGR